MIINNILFNAISYPFNNDKTQLIQKLKLKLNEKIYLYWSVKLNLLSE